MSNHLPKPIRYTFTQLVDSAKKGENNGFKVLLQAHTNDISAFICNNQYLLTLRGVSAYRQLRDLYNDTHVMMDKRMYSALKLRKKLTCSLTCLEVLAYYWGLSVRDMLTDPEEFKILAESKGFKVA